MFCIMIVSLPVQGIAASVRSACMMEHGVTVIPYLGTIHQGDEPKVAIPHMAELASSAATYENMPFDHGAHEKHSSCRIFSSCCTGVSAPPPFAIPLPFSAHVVNGTASTISSFTDWIPSRIERPPRV